jgi:uncharacterized protein (DUF983 family)
MTARTPVLERLRVQYEQAGLRPLVDPLMEMIVMDCPHCRAQDQDEWGLYRPVRVVPRGRNLTIRCMACGRDA